MDNDALKCMTQKIIDSLQEDSPLRPYIKDSGDSALLSILVALLFMPGEDMKRVAQEMLKRMQEEASDA